MVDMSVMYVEHDLCTVLMTHNIQNGLKLFRNPGMVLIGVMALNQRIPRLC